MTRSQMILEIGHFSRQYARFLDESLANPKPTDLCDVVPLEKAEIDALLAPIQALQDARRILDRHWRCSDGIEESEGLK